MGWSAEARRVIGAVHASLPSDCSLADRRAALKAAYPFGHREAWPYKAWLKEQRQYLARYEDRPEHLSPMERLMRKALA